MMAAPIAWKFSVRLVPVLGLSRAMKPGIMINRATQHLNIVQASSLQASSVAGSENKKNTFDDETRPTNQLSSLQAHSFGSAKTKITSTNNETENCEELDALCRLMEVEVRGHDPAVLKSYEWFALEAAKQLNITVDKTWVPPKHVWRRPVLKSAFVHKKHLVQYEIRTYFRVMQFKYLTGSTASAYLEYIQRNLPEGVAMKVTKHSIEKTPNYMQH